MNAPASASRLNDGQRAALDLSRDMLVSAGAGAGKTQVLGLRYLAILEEGLATVPEIVAFTFTEKAAAEMRERVQELLLARIGEVEDETRLARLKRAQAEFALNHISTIHGYCHRLLRDYAWEAGLEPHAPILDERAQALARERAIREVLFRSESFDHPNLTPALVRLGSVVRLFALTDSLSRMLRDRAAVRAPLHRAAELWAEPDVEVARRHAQYTAMIDEHLQATVAAIGRIEFATADGAKAGDKLREQVQALRAAAERGDLDALDSELLNKDHTPSKPKGAKGNWKHDLAGLDRVREQVMAAAVALSEAGDVLGVRFDESLERRIGVVACDLRIVFDALCEAYARECAGGLDFLDLELRTLELLREDEEVRRQAIRAARYMLIDEYQDTNPTQAELFGLLTDESDAPGRFFAVGDSKQSIYAFRGSDVRVFNRALVSIPERNRKSGAAGRPVTPPWALTCDDTPERRSGVVRLQHNYRTVQPVLELGNEVFRNVLARAEFREFDARPQDMLFGGDPDQQAGAEHPVEYHILPEAGADDEAEYIAQLVERMHSRDGVPYSDVTILVRRSTRNADYRNAFARRRVPLLVVGEGGLFRTQEALDCIGLLSALANPADDVAVLGLLRSPFAGLSDAVLTRLAFETDAKLPLLTRLESWPECPPHATQFVQRFHRLCSRAGRDAPALLLGEALSAFGYSLAVGCGPDADQRLANVGRMLELVRGMQHELPSLAPLVRELRDRIDRDEEETQGVPDQGVDGVRLMTIHKSKGLEFPVVILPDLGSDLRGNSGGLYRDLPDEEGEPLGFYLKSLDDDDRGDYRSDFAAWRARASARERGLAEEKRALYVAWTRAAQRLVLVAGLKPGKEFDRDLWAHQLLRALGVRDWGADATHECLAMHWPDAVERTPPQPNTPAIEAARNALAAGEISLPTAIDVSLVAPIEEPVRAGALDPLAAEFGTLVHAEIERSLRGVEVGTLDARARSHVMRAAESLETLPTAKRLLPEFGIMTPDGPRRLDLLRELSDGSFEIIDYKTDAVDGSLAEYAEAEHGRQLRGYADALADYLNSRGRKPGRIRLLVCFTAADGLRPSERLVEIAPG
ncbi:MAG: UvrD-helicase domain-containing protein [Planctomycetes bacterium]|nr:UvrD-helicase domain-containing protein [Planctomycetota bacterium]